MRTCLMCGRMWALTKRQRHRQQSTCSRKCGRAKQQRTIDFPESVNWSPPVAWVEWHPLCPWEADLDGDELAEALARPLVAMRLVSGGGGRGVGWGCGEGPLRRHWSQTHETGRSPDVGSVEASRRGV